MVNLEKYLENRLRDIISSWDENDIYAISFFVYSNESFEFDGCSNVTEFSVGYNTERDCAGGMSYRKNAGIMLFGVKMKPL